MSDNGAQQVPPPPPQPPQPAARPRPRRSRSPVVEFLGGLMSLAFLAALLAVAGVYWSLDEFRAPGPLRQDKVIYFPRGQGVEEIATQLEREGVVSNAWLFQLGARLSHAKLKAGEYRFKQHASMRDVVAIFDAGKSILHAITIPEGLTSEQIVARLEDNDVLVGDVPRVPPEGSLLPETYKFTRGTTRQDLLQKMAKDRLKVLQDAWQHRAPGLPIGSPEDLVTLASIVEKETGKPEERPHVAAVFYNRLKKQMKLQSDPTIIYGLVGGKGSLGHPIQKSEIDKQTPYNTYVIHGLPPTPISNPGRQAIEAAARPADSNDLYFVADGTGGHAFAETVDQHRRNVAHWREIESQRRDASGTAGTDSAAAQPGADDRASPDLTAPLEETPKPVAARRKSSQRPRAVR